jgi:tRNA threonylcarbamoyladenosine biosynthesis protein TsaB
MKYLAIDCSTETAQLSFCDGKNAVHLEIPSVREHARQLLPHIQKGLSELSWSLSSLDGIIFGRGPGSFTGLRVACAIAKGLAFAHDLPLFPVSSLASMAYQAFEKSVTMVPVLCVLDARMGQWYWAVYQPNNYTAQENVNNPEDIHLPDPKIMIAGRSLNAYNSQFDKRIIDVECNWIDLAPKTSAMITLVRTKIVPSVPIDEAQPVYVRNQVAQGAKRG